MRGTANPRRLYTVGHSTRSSEAFVDLLREHAIERVVDVRRYPGSRRHPQFGQEALARELAAHAIEYVLEPDLGGRRVALPDSQNAAWRNSSFRGYADHMASPEFLAAFERVLDAAQGRNVAVMCAEAHPSRCHRRLLADAAGARGVAVVHAIEPGRSEAHAMHPDARIGSDGSVVYPATRQGELGFDG